MAKEKILIVDDVPDNVEILEQFFKTQGYEILKAFGGKEAIEKAEKETPDLILLDIMMPDLDGFEVCRILKQERTHFKSIPILMVTAKDDLESKVKGLSLGADDYITKPFDMQELHARVKSALRLKHALDALKELNELKNQFLAMASHDIKAPISRIEKTMDQLLEKKEKLSKDQSESLKNIKRQAQDIFNLISDLLNVTKIEAGKMGLQKKKISVSELLEEVCKMNVMTAQSKQISLDRNIDPKVEITADPDRLLEVFDNLLTNAIKFTPKGKKIKIVLQSQKEGVEVQVSDQGIGIPESELPRIFDRFSKLSPQPTQGESGTGLGLSITKQIIDLHGGKIQVESKPDHGSLFKIFLPKV